MTVSVIYDPLASGDPDEIVFENVRFRTGESVEVSDLVALRVLGNPHFTVRTENDDRTRRDAEFTAAEAQKAAQDQGDGTDDQGPDAPKRRGRPPKSDAN